MSKEKLICPGDSIEVNTYGYVAKGFILSHFMTSKAVGSDNFSVVSWMLIDQNNKVVFFKPSDIYNTTRIVLTEKVKIPIKLNEEFNDMVSEAEREFKSRQYIFKSRQTGMNMAFANSVVFNSLFKEQEVNTFPSDVQKGISKGNITIITGKSK
jgi:hypothetical protein